MNMMKKIALSITRRKKKSMILFMLILLITTIIATIFVVRGEVETINHNTRLAYGGAVRIVLDLKKIQDDNLNEEQFYQLENTLSKDVLTKDSIKMMGNQPGVKAYDYYSQYTLFSDTLKKITANESENAEIASPIWQPFTINGTNNEETLGIVSGDEKLVAGQVFSLDDITTGANKAIISQKMASKNNVEIGDTIIFEEVVRKPDKTGVVNVEILFEAGDKNNALITKKISLEVIGMIESNSTSLESEFENEKLNNKIYVPNKIIEDDFSVVQDILNQHTSEQSNTVMSMYDVTFLLTDPEDVEKFRTTVNGRLGDYLITEVSQNGYEDIKAALNSINELMSYSLVTTVIVGSLLIGVLFLMQLRERKRELGIYVALGEARYRIILTLLGELLVISFLACTVSLISGNLIASIISDNIIVMPEVPNIQVQEIEGTLDIVSRESSNRVWVYILDLYGVVFFICIISVSIPGMYVLLLNPRKILL